MRLPRRSVLTRRSALADFSLKALSETDVRVLLGSAAEVAARTLGVHFASAFELQADERTLRLVAGYGWQPSDEPVLAPLDSTLPVAEAVRNGRPVLVKRGVAKRFRDYGMLSRERVETSAAVVIESAGQPFGGLVVHSRRAGAIRRSDLPFLTSLASVVAVAIARERAVAEARGLATIVESCEDAIFSRTLDGVVTTWNAAAERLYGYSAEEMIGRSLHALIPSDRAGEIDELSKQLGAGQVVRNLETVRLHKDRTRIDVSATLSPIRDESGRIASISVVSRAIGEEKRARDETQRALESEQKAREAAEGASERLSFLGRASEILAGSLDFEQTLTSVARLCVPRLADWCMAYVLGDGGQLVRVALAHGDPEKAELAEKLKRTGVPSTSGDHGLAVALRTGTTQLTRATDGENASAAGGDPELLKLYREFSTESVMSVPLLVRDRVLGAMVFLSDDPQRTYREDDLRLAEEIARRAALAVDNARLYMDARRELERRKETEESLRRSEEQYRLLFEANPNPMWFFDPETFRFLAVNEAAVRQYGYTREEFLEMKSTDIRPAEEVEAFQRSVKDAVLTGGLATAGIWRHKRKDGSIVEVGITTQPLAFEGQPAQVVLAIDLTERQAAEQALRQSEARYRELVENASELIATVDLDSGFTSVNAAFAKAVGYTQEELIGRSLRDFVPPEQHEQLERARLTKLEGEEASITYEHDLIARDGRRVTVEVASRLIEEGGRTAGVQAICRDVSERKAAEHALRAAEQRYRTLVEGLPLVTFTHAPTQTARATYMSPQVEELLGYPRQEWMSDPDLFWRVLHPDDAERLRIAEAQRTPFDEFRMRARDGREVWVYGRRKLVRDEQGQPLYVQGFWLDVSEKRRAEEALRESQELYELVVENARDMIGIFDAEGRFLFASPSHTAVLGYAAEELIGQVASDFRHPDDAASVSAAVVDPDALAGGLSVRHRIRHKDGHYVELEGFVVPIFNSDGSLRMILSTSRDVSDRLRAEELADQLRQAQKMEAIGRLAGGIAHDFNNLLTIITGYSDLARMRTEPESIQNAIEQIAAAAKTGSALTGQLLAFSRQQVVRPRLLDAALAIRNAEGLLDRLIGEDIELELDLETDLAAINADPTQVEQVLLNLASNAREAMPEGGRLTIEARTISVEEGEVPPLVGLEPGRSVVISVGDTGVGMDESTRARMFEPFFTTKEDGTGLGLATVHGILTQSGGRVLVESEPGAGTTFRLVFPAVQGPPAEPAVDTAPLGDLDGSQTVLIVEDEDLVRGLAEEILSGHGYTVLAAGTPEEALAIASSWKEPLHLVLSDVMLPGKRGPRLVDEVQSLHPEAKTIYTSGYAPALIEERGVQSEQPFLAKPFTATDLALKVREVLAA
jgi:two-component system cell cycle sensor histidine kinase/response regulator CckA